MREFIRNQLENRGKRWRIQTVLAKNDHAAMFLRTRDSVVKQPALMLGTTRGGVGPEHDDVREFTILGALYRHREMTEMPSRAKPRLVMDGFPNKLRNFIG